mmetsp:Transcript_55535/g.91982  ORF Transcript_55535/g.91982 Transcript_55535/m.91982 type:complete len:133 (+) Transcript_55535:11-409(+)|eukprot:CAMPEP_0119331168 /NCGR_PEP_ID=MMETSP1333-20130426/79960_1 /TAXON_ID=418940 /ORGANISM="Scyphosphaera apsteinii, Strain RCC1455" /LENGTH=132 /DNA_ID=CAMNT_0007340699 /DNA_START=9 /DNA_END=407 /DNA_ORIENTATION=+
MDDEIEYADERPGTAAVRSKVLGLGLSLPPSAMSGMSGSGAALREAEESKCLGGEVTLILILEDGSEHNLTVETSHTVEFVKERARTEVLRATTSSLELKLDDKMLMGPMSLRDYPDIVAGTAVRLHCVVSH